MNWNYSQGGAKFPTGGKHKCKPASAFMCEGSSRSGVIPEPTVIVRMKGNVRAIHVRWVMFACDRLG